MKKLLFILILIPVLSFSQNSESSNLAIGLSFSPDLNHRFINGDKNFEWFYEGEIPQFGFNTGINLDWRFSHRFSFNPGILFSQYGFNRKATLRESPHDIEGFEGKFKSQFYYLDIPLKMKFYVTDRPVGFFIAAGVSPNIYLSSRYAIKSDEHSEHDWNRENEISKINLSVLGGLGLNYNISSHLFIEAEALFKSFVLSETASDDTLLKRYFYSLGLNLSLYYRF